MDLQLTIDGGEIPLADVYRARLARWTPAQRAILLHIDTFGQIRSFEAGRILHADRKARGGGCGVGERTLKTDRAKSCCAYAPTDGNEALRRLARRGAVVRAGRGVWRRA